MGWILARRGRGCWGFFFFFFLFLKWVITFVMDKLDLEIDFAEGWTKAATERRIEVLHHV